MKNFALIGAAGYIAPRHMKAINETGNRLAAAVDVSDSVGIIDSHFPDAEFFTEFELYNQFVNDIKDTSKAISYTSICSPNYLHKSHMSSAMRSGCNVICEKPIVLDPADLDDLAAVEVETGRCVSTILQLRLHPAIKSLRDEIKNLPNKTKHDVTLTYITSRGKWYLASWKGDIKKSGGIATNIGVHFFDMLHFVFGKPLQNIVHLRSDTKSAGYIEYENARVRWFLSLDEGDIPLEARAKGMRTFRSIDVGGREVEFSGGFTDLHTVSYKEILAGKGFGLSENRVAIETVYAIRNEGIKSAGEKHPFIL